MRELGWFSNVPYVLTGPPKWQQLENQKDSHSIKDFFRLNPHEHENMDIDAIPKHHKIGFPKELLIVPLTKWGASSRCSSGPNTAILLNAAWSSLETRIIGKAHPA